MELGWQRLLCPSLVPFESCRYFLSQGADWEGGGMEGETGWRGRRGGKKGEERERSQENGVGEEEVEERER